MGAKAWQRRLLILVFWWRLTYAVFVPFRVPLCPKVSVPDAIFDFRDSYCPITSAHTESIEFVGVTEGDEVSLQKALNMIYKNSNQYVAVLFYASWCPFSSILSKYGVHGFPTLFLLNSTMRARYHGNRSLKSVSAFYGDVTGIKNCLDQISLGRISRMSNHEKHNSTEQESCPFPWARSPENLLRQETYLALATTFVLLRLLYLLYPTMLVIAQLIWTLLIQNVKLGALLEHPLAYLKRAIQLFNSLKEPCKRSNLQGAMNARAWASKSLATVSIGDANTSRAVPITGCH
ncbi:5'-adenylylsulfate reductase-like 4 isoform X2 [Hibiscus syriacus]|uniref:5'-adenylylsulfate reductase-like 4 isoform X2 n=1 Tax=Hibiscus syriacus TaxID=106335 RepID=UPI0019211370|nr:5'-adenylylsulfate reductase-like 4 isoform X2 [Hibiscus syriacus]